MTNNNVVTLVIPNEIKYLPMVGSCVMELCQLAPGLVDEAYAMQLAVHEACTNVIEHAHGGAPDKTVRLEFALSPDELSIAIYDQGPGFDPTTVHEPEPDDLQERGYGVMIMRNVMDQMRYQTNTVYGNCLTLTKYFERTP